MKLIPTVVTQKVSRQVLTMQKNAPRTLFVVGIVGVVGSTLLACRATLKLESVVDTLSDDIDGIRARKSSQVLAHRKYSQTDYNRDLAYVYAKGAMQLGKLYGPALIVGTVSIGALTGSHVTLTRRNNSLMAAYSAVAASFEAYRERVRKEMGDEKELEVYHAVSNESVTIDKKIQELRTADPNKWSPYAKFFDEYNHNWQKNSEYNRLFITCQQNYANDLLRARGHIFLNEVYDMLGFEHTSAGAVVGWIIGKDGDNFIDFGIYEATNARFVNGIERSIILDFNVDGVIYDKI
jgi:Family of unknown function (DUF6353)